MPDLPSGTGFGATRTLSSNLGADTRELALKIFSGSTLPPARGISL